MTGKRLLTKILNDTYDFNTRLHTVSVTRMLKKGKAIMFYLREKLFQITEFIRQHETLPAATGSMKVPLFPSLFSSASDCL